MATLFVRHPVADYAEWRRVYDSIGPMQGGSASCTSRSGPGQAGSTLPTSCRSPRGNGGRGWIEGGQLVRYRRCRGPYRPVRPVLSN
jgi:hypothetical protein